MPCSSRNCIVYKRTWYFEEPGIFKYAITGSNITLCYMDAYHIWKLTLVNWGCNTVPLEMVTQWNASVMQWKSYHSTDGCVCSHVNMNWEIEKSSKLSPFNHLCGKPKTRVYYNFFILFDPFATEGAVLLILDLIKIWYDSSSVSC